MPEGVLPHGRPDFKEGKPVLEPIFSREDYERRLETYRDPALGEPSFFLQYMTVYTNPDNTRFKDEWFIVHTKTGWTAPKRRVICLDDASKDFQQPGQGDYSVAQFGEWDDDGRLLLVPRRQGLYGAFAFGSRGLLWAGLGAELIASLLEGEPLPVERRLADALDPARFLLRALRRYQRSSFSSS